MAGSRIVVASLLVIVGWVSAVEAQAPRESERIEELEKRQDELSDELRELRKAVEEPEKEVEEVERRQGILTEEIRRLREALVLPEERELKSHYGLGPAASKVYGTDRGISIGGYGEFIYRAELNDETGGSNVFDLQRFITYIGYKYNDWVVLNSEIEFEHAFIGAPTISADEGLVEIEFATLDFLLHEKANVRTGLVLVPMGFLNEIHEPPFFHGNDRPLLERRLIPTTWRALGGGLFGELVPGLEYRAYGITSLNAKGLRPEGLAPARQSGNRERAETFSLVTRADYTGLPGTTIGGSFYVGDQGQNQDFEGSVPDVFLQLYEGHVQFRRRGFQFRSLVTFADIGDADVVSADVGRTIAEQMFGYYFEIAYDVLPHVLPGTTHSLVPWVRYEKVDTQHEVPSGFEREDRQDLDLIEFGIDYFPIPDVVFKVDYRIADSASVDQPDNLRVGGGFVF